MKYKILICLFTLIVLKAQGQNFGFGHPCNVNVNQSQGFRDIVKRATFKITFVGPDAGNCTGTLVNRDIHQNELGFYFIIARHCLIGTTASTGIDPTRNHRFYFNYQAPDPSNNLSTPISNRGLNNGQSTSTTPIIGNIGNDAERYQYYHESPIRIVSWNVYGDFALCEILNPIPPHFNVAFAGWNPGIGTFSLNSYFMPHHPLGDIKKMVTTNVATSPSNSACRIVTKVIDFLFGWIWGRNVSTEVVCTYVEVPWGNVPFWNTGIVQEGSSGSGFFNGNNKLIATLSGSVGGCTAQTGFVGTLRSGYYNQSVKNTLNPENKFWVDQLGIDGRIITCHQNLNNLSGEYFAASAYQANNKITLQSATTLTSNGVLRIHPGADYSFVASQDIVFGPGFETVPPQPGEIGGVFETIKATCVVPRSDEKSNDIPSDVMRKARNLELPQYKPFNPRQFLNKDNGLVDLDAQSEIQAYPNPSSDGNFTVRFMVNAKKSVNLAFTDLLGKTIYTTQYSCIQGENYFPLDMSGKGIAEGMYFITVDDGVNKKVKKVVIK